MKIREFLDKENSNKEFSNKGKSLLFGLGTVSRNFLNMKNGLIPEYKQSMWSKPRTKWGKVNKNLLFRPKLNFSPHYYG